jgi:hypothetical protein
MKTFDDVFQTFDGFLAVPGDVPRQPGDGIEGFGDRRGGFREGREEF